MHFQQDWIMRQINVVLAVLVSLITGERKSVVTFEDFIQTASKENDFYRRLDDLVKQGKICEAENILFDAIDKKDKSVLESAILFYSEINKLTDAELEKCDFSRDEIGEGLKDVCREYGIPYDLF